MLISLPNGEYAFGMPVLRCSTCREDRPAAAIGDGKHMCLACRTVIEPLSPRERYMAANGVAAINEATSTPVAAGAKVYALDLTRRQRAMVTNLNEVTVGWRDLTRNDVIVFDPEHPHIPGEWPFITAILTGGMVHIHAGSECGCERTFHVDPYADIVVRRPNGGNAA